MLICLLFKFSSFSSKSHKSNKIVNLFNSNSKKSCLPFVSFLENYLTEIGIDMGMDELVQYQITVNNGQVNLAQDNSTISAVQNNNGLDFNHLQELIDSIQSAANNGNVATADSKQIVELLTGIKEELQKPSPKKSIVSMLINGLTSTATLLGAIPVVSQKINEFIKYVEPYLA